VIVEHALLRLTPGREEEFASALRLALPLIDSAPGCHGAEVRRQVEDPSIYLLLVRWDSVEAHDTFRSSDLYGRWRDLTHPHYAERPDVTHFAEPVER
jgi:heme-degrading monooxygenase HmoA